MRNELNLRLMLLGGIISAIAAVAAPYITLKLGMGIDLSMGGMFLAAALLGRELKGKELAVELNMVQTMVSAASGVSFMVVILAAFYYVQNVFDHDIGFNPKWWQLCIWLLVSSSLGIFLGSLVRKMVLDDRSLPWPTGHVGKGVIDTLSDPSATELVKTRRSVLTVTTGVAGLITFMRDGLGVITPMIGNSSLVMMFSLEPAIIGLGMVVPLSVGLSGLLGVWWIQEFGENVAQWAALAGTSEANWAQCVTELGAGEVTDFLTANCGHATEFLGAGSHFKYLVQWTMWPATAMMIAAALTSVLVPLIGNLIGRSKSSELPPEPSLADERVSTPLMLGGMAVCILLLTALQWAWFDMPPQQVLLAVALQPLLVIAGLRVLGLTGSGPVSLMANATQFVFGLIWPNHIQQNLNAAHVSADPQASSEGAVGAFWVARKVGGSFNALIVGQLIAIAIAAFAIPIVFTALVDTYGVGLEPGQLSAPTALKIASLAMVMESGLGALPHGCLEASAVAIGLGVLFELMLMAKKRDAAGKLLLDSNGNTSSRFWWVPVPSALGFALILPPSLSIGMAVGSVISAVWRAFSPPQPPTSEKGPSAFQTFGAPLAAGLVAGEAIVGGIVLPLLVLAVEQIRGFFFG
ncbi:MAG: OPT/YSL family transporter [Myxococcales bacterium]|nr:OPT/YSL family transporter [Myxococcales bacterium]MCB9533396.1 OPT/YSL family transporter [Myxococcales bacterium]